MVVQLQLRNDTAANWTAANPILAKGEMGIEIDTKKRKLGDGTTAWNALAYDLTDLPVASDTVAGVIKVGTRLTIASGVLSADPVGVMTPSVRGGARLGSGLTITDTDVLSVVPYSLPIASDTVLGGIKVGANLSINGSGVLSASAAPYTLPVATPTIIGGVKIGDGITITDGVISVDTPADPTGLAGTTNGSFQIDNDNSGPTLAHLNGLLSIDKTIKSTNGEIQIGQSSVCNRQCWDGFDADYAEDPDASAHWSSSVTGSVTVNSVEYGGSTPGNLTVIANITVATAGAAVQLKHSGCRHLTDLIRCASWFSVGAAPGGNSKYQVWTESENGQKFLWERAISGTASLFLDDSTAVESSFSATGESIIVQFTDLAVGTYNIVIESMWIGGRNTLVLSHAYEDNGILDINWDDNSIPARVFAGGLNVLAGLATQYTDNNDNPFGGYAIPNLKIRDDIGTDRMISLVDMPITTLAGSFSSKMAFLDQAFCVSHSQGIGLGARQDGMNNWAMKYSVPNMTFNENADNWLAEAVSGVTINSQTWDADCSGVMGSGCIKINVTVTGTGSLKIKNLNCRRLMYPRYIRMGFKSGGTNGMMGLDVVAETDSDYNYERFVFSTMRETVSSGNGWRTVAFESSNVTFDTEEYVEVGGEAFIVTISNMPAGTYDFQFEGLYLYADSFVFIQHDPSMDTPLGINITTNEDTKPSFSVDGDLVMIFRGSSATAPTGDLYPGHCYIDTSGTPVLKMWDGTAWV